MIAEVLMSTGLAATAAIAAAKLRSRRERIRRRAQLRSLAFEHGMKLLGVEEHDFFEIDQSDDHGRVVDCDLVGVMEGHDGAGTFSLGYRYVGGMGQHFLRFEVDGEDHPEGLHLHPEGDRGAEPGWLRRWHSLRSPARIQRGARLSLQWNADPEAFRSERRWAIATRWIDEIARGAGASSALRVGLTVQRSEVTLYTTNALADASLASFYERGMRLRRMMTRGVGDPPARRTVRTATTSAETRVIQRRRQESTRPVEAVNLVRAQDDEEHKIIDLSVEELLRERPPERPKAFEVPEPEEEVRVLASR